MWADGHAMVGGEANLADVCHVARSIAHFADIVELETDWFVAKSVLWLARAFAPTFSAGIFTTLTFVTLIFVLLLPLLLG